MKEATQRQLQKIVLQLLQQVGPINYNLLCLQVDFHNGLAVGVLGELMRRHHIEVDSKKMVKITDVGYRLLDDMNYWTEGPKTHTPESP